MSVAIQAFGQKWLIGSLEPLAGEKKMCMEIDFSEAIIHGMTETEFSLYETDWEKDQTEIYRKMFAPMQERIGERIILVKMLDTPYKLRVCVTSVSVKGDYDCYAVIVNDKNETIATINNIHASGGRIGSNLNLIKDGAEHTGEKLGAILKRELAKIQKNK